MTDVSKTYNYLYNVVEFHVYSRILCMILMTAVVLLITRSTCCLLPRMKMVKTSHKDPNRHAWTMRSSPAAALPVTPSTQRNTSLLRPAAAGHTLLLCCWRHAPFPFE